MPEPDNRTVAVAGRFVLRRNQKLRVYFLVETSDGVINCQIDESRVVPADVATSFRLLFPECATSVVIAEPARFGEMTQSLVVNGNSKPPFRRRFGPTPALVPATSMISSIYPSPGKL